MKLEKWLEEQNVGASEFGRRVNVSHTAVGRWMRRERVPRPAQIAAIARETAGAVTAADFYAVEAGRTVSAVPEKQGAA